MLTPQIRYVEPDSLSLPPKCRGKWYVSLMLSPSIHRYLHPHGWERHAYYFQTRQDAEKALRTHETSKVPEVTVEENDYVRQREREALEESDYLDDYYYRNGYGDENPY